MIYTVGVRKGSLRAGVGAALFMLSAWTQAATAAPLKIGYSDWPGWVAWQVAIEKGWFKDAGVDVSFEWFDYVPSMEAYQAGKLDAVAVTNGDALVMGSSGAKSLIILVNDYSNGNDMVVAKPGIKSLKDLKGKKIGVEIGVVDHLMLLVALENAGMKESDVELVNTKTNETPQVLASGQVDAIVAWQPSSGQALKQVAGSTAVYTSAAAPGLLYDVLAVTPASYAAHRPDWVKVCTVWKKVVAYITDPKTQDDAVKIMSARVGLKPEEYKPLLAGTKLHTLADGKAAFVKGTELKSIIYSTQVADDFNVKNAVYKEKQDVASYFEPSITNELAK